MWDCDRRESRTSQKNITWTPPPNFIVAHSDIFEEDENPRCCKKCALRCRRMMEDEEPDSKRPRLLPSTSNENASTSVLLPGITKVQNSGSHCIVCGVKVTIGCRKIPYYARLELLLDHQFLVLPASNCRICEIHLNGNHLVNDLEITQEYETRTESDEAELDSAEATKVILDLIEALRSHRDEGKLNFNDEGAMGDEDYRIWTGWDQEQFNEMLPHINSMRSTENGSVREALAIFWIKIKTDLSFSQIASLLGIKSNDLQQAGRLTVSLAFYAVKEELANNLIPLYLGPFHMTPKEALKHNTVYSKTFFGNKPTTIWDGTYLYTHRSSNYAEGRKFYSMHKSRNLAKFMSIVLPDGYVLHTIGPFYSNGANNDAGMTAKILQDEEHGMSDWLKVGQQVVVVDRGFRNVVPHLEKQGNLTLKMPTVSNGKQDSVQQANNSRLVTKVRWVVEAYHGRFKKFKFFENRQRPSFILHYQQLLQILTSALNAFRPPLYDTSIDQGTHQRVATEMLRRSRLTENPLALKVAKGPLSAKGRKWEEVIAIVGSDEIDLAAVGAVPNFPQLTEDYIKDTITLGSYQVKQAAHYADEHLAADGLFRIMIHHEADNLIRARLQSRHQNSTKYFLWIEYDTTSVKGWFCQCKAGMRMVGCCAHVATLVWYLSYARHQGYSVSKAFKAMSETVIDSKGSGFEDSEEEDMPDAE